MNYYEEITRSQFANYKYDDNPILLKFNKSELERLKDLKYLIDVENNIISGYTETSIRMFRAGTSLLIFKIPDEWYLIHARKLDVDKSGLYLPTSSFIYYRCDQMEGLIICIKDI